MVFIIGLLLLLLLFPPFLRFLDSQEWTLYDTLISLKDSGWDNEREWCIYDEKFGNSIMIKYQRLHSSISLLFYCFLAILLLKTIFNTQMKMKWKERRNGTQPHFVFKYLNSMIYLLNFCIINRHTEEIHIIHLII